MFSMATVQYGNRQNNGNLNGDVTPGKVKNMPGKQLEKKKVYAFQRS